jgi:hypothetical protein
MRRQGVLGAWCLGVLMQMGAAEATAYDGKVHQFLTFLAAKQFNRCVEHTDLPALTPLQVRYIARANASLVDRSVFARMFNWRYYDPADHEAHNFLWLVDTRFHSHYNELSERLGTEQDPVTAYQDLGRLVSYIQMVTAPSRAVPVYAARFWRLSFSDRFDGFPVDEEALTAALEDDCSFLDDRSMSYADVLSETADRTLAAVRGPIDGMPTHWTAFWTPSRDPGSFGDYGPAGNSFGRRTEFRCGGGQRCVLLQDDPLYRDFALARHVDAVRGTQAAMLLMQSGRRDAVASAR